MRTTLIWVLLAAASLGVLALGVKSGFELSADDTMRFFVRGGWLILILAALIPRYRWRRLEALRHFAIWAAIAFALMAAYSFRDEIKAVGSRVTGELLPPGSVMRAETGPRGEESVRLRRQPGGQFVARMSINDQTITMLVDTGASTVTLSASDAAKAGIDAASLKFTVAVNTANGQAFAAPVRLRKLSLGPLVLTDVDALVARPGALTQSLLGMSFLRRLRSYEFSGEFLTLRS